MKKILQIAMFKVEQLNLTSLMNINASNRDFHQKDGNSSNFTSKVSVLWLSFE